MKPVRALQKSSGNSSTTNCGSGAATSGSDRHPFTLPPLVAGTAVLAGCIDILLVSVRRTKVSRCHFFYRGRDRTSVLGRSNRHPPSDPTNLCRPRLSRIAHINRTCDSIGRKQMPNN
jgi:hypothetical protein